MYCLVPRCLSGTDARKKMHWKVISFQTWTCNNSIQYFYSIISFIWRLKAFCKCLIYYIPLFFSEVFKYFPQCRRWGEIRKWSDFPKTAQWIRVRVRNKTVASKLPVCCSNHQIRLLPSDIFRPLQPVKSDIFLKGAQWFSLKIIILKAWISGWNSVWFVGQTRWLQRPCLVLNCVKYLPHKPHLPFLSTQIRN